MIQAILKELPLCEGHIYVNGVVSYASQEPWLFASSVRQNIIFGSPMDNKRYAKVDQNYCYYEKGFMNCKYT